MLHPLGLWTTTPTLFILSLTYILHSHQSRHTQCSTFQNFGQRPLLLYWSCNYRAVAEAVQEDMAASDVENKQVGQVVMNRVLVDHSVCKVGDKRGAYKPFLGPFLRCTSGNWILYQKNVKSTFMVQIWKKKQKMRSWKRGNGNPSVSESGFQDQIKATCFG